jgi:hypothetical protein
MKFSTLRQTAATAALVGLSIAGLPAQQSQQTVTITVKAPDGTVVKGASAVARIGYPSQGVTVPVRLEAAGDGQLIGKAHNMGRQGSPMVLSIHASAPGWGFVSTSTDIAAGTMEMEATVTLVPGRQVPVRLVPDGGRALPADLPLLIGPESDIPALATP